ncbi:hypothetical protein IJG72_06390 [bacterium]|nr:hypothetical protein [bacterium]
MKTVFLDENNNIVLKAGNIQLKDGIEALAQDIKTRVGLYRGENRFDITEGIDFDNEVLGKFGGVEYYRQIIRNRIEDAQEVEGVKRITLEKIGTQLKVTADIKSIYGDVAL